MELKQAAKQMEALGNETRLAVFRILIQMGSNGIPVGEIQQRLMVPASTLSHHINKLIQAGLMTQTRQSRTLICAADYPRMNELMQFLMKNCCGEMATVCESALGDSPSPEQKGVRNEKPGL